MTLGNRIERAKNRQRSNNRELGELFAHTLRSSPPIAMLSTKTRLRLRASFFTLGSVSPGTAATFSDGCLMSNRFASRTNHDHVQIPLLHQLL
jgi:hypothetical protein